ncbi:MAG: hypothetical protein ABI895_40960 [Deltaproteobacteria bacterium]
MPSAERGAVELQGVRKSYGLVEVLRGVDLELQRGEVGVRVSRLQWRGRRRLLYARVDPELSG